MNGDILITVLGLGLAVTLMVTFPLMTMADRNDDISQSVVQTAVTEFVNDVRTTGELTLEGYEKFVENISATGNAYDVEIEIKIKDENAGKKLSQANSSKAGEDKYVSMYKSQVMDILNSGETIKLKEGDIISITVKNTNTTMAQTLKNMFYKVVGNDNASILASDAGMVTARGTR